MADYRCESIADLERRELRLRIEKLEAEQQKASSSEGCGGCLGTIVVAALIYFLLQAAC